MTDLVALLRMTGNPLCEQAAKEIERLREQLENSRTSARLRQRRCEAAVLQRDEARWIARRLLHDLRLHIDVPTIHESLRWLEEAVTPDPHGDAGPPAMR